MSGWVGSLVVPDWPSIAAGKRGLRSALRTWAMTFDDPPVPDNRKSDAASIAAQPSNVHSSAVIAAACVPFDIHRPPMRCTPILPALRTASTHHYPTRRCECDGPLIVCVLCAPYAFTSVVHESNLRFALDDGVSAASTRTFAANQRPFCNFAKTENSFVGRYRRNFTIPRKSRKFFLSIPKPIHETFDVSLERSAANRQAVVQFVERDLVAVHLAACPLRLAPSFQVIAYHARR